MTPAQLTLIKADIAASPDLAAIPVTADGNYEIARLYNLPSVPDFLVWRTDAPSDAIYDAIDTTKYTPADAPSLTNTAVESALWLNRSQLILIKQAVLQFMLQGRDRINMAKVTVRNNLRDAIIAIPAGTGGANVSASGAGGVTALNAGLRNATRGEKLLATASIASDTTGPVTARVMGFEGYVTLTNIDEARAI